MERKKSYSLLIVGAILLIAGIILAVYTHNTSYQSSIATGDRLAEVKAQISAAQAQAAGTDLDALKAQQAQLSAEKLSQERPYSYSLALVFLSVLLTIKGIYNALRGVHSSSRTDVKRLAMTGLMAALCYIGFAFLKIDMPIGSAAIHFGNIFCVLAALLLGGYWGGMAGAVGMTIGDLTTAYATSAPKTFLLKLLIGLIVGFVAHNIFKLDQDHDVKYVTKVTILSSACGMGFNIIADPVVGYFYKTYLLGIPQDLAATLAKINLGVTAVNAVIAVILASLFYLALRPALRKSGLFIEITSGRKRGK